MFLKVNYCSFSLFEPLSETKIKIKRHITSGSPLISLVQFHINTFTNDYQNRVSLPMCGGGINWLSIRHQ